MKGMIMLYTTFPNRESAALVCRELVKEKLAACCNFFEVKSIYEWNGELQFDDEVVAIIKTHESVVKKTVERIEELHPYEIPVVAQIKVSEVNDAYGNWMLQYLGVENSHNILWNLDLKGVYCKTTDGERFSFGDEGEYEWLLLFLCPDPNAMESVRLSKILSDRYKELRALGVEVIGIYDLPSDDLAEYRKLHGIDFKTACFDDCSQIGLLEKLKSPVSLLLNKDGNVRHVWNNPSPNSHGEDVIRKVREIMI